MQALPLVSCGCRQCCVGVVAVLYCCCVSPLAVREIVGALPPTSQLILIERAILYKVCTPLVDGSVSKCSHVGVWVELYRNTRTALRVQLYPCTAPVVRIPDDQFGCGDRESAEIDGSSSPSTPLTVTH